MIGNFKIYKGLRRAVFIFTPILIFIGVQLFVYATGLKAPPILVLDANDFSFFLMFFIIGCTLNAGCFAGSMILKKIYLNLNGNDSKTM